MIEITADTTLAELCKIPELREAAPYFLYGMEMEDKPLKAYKEINWNPDSMISGILRLGSLMPSGPVLHRLYSEAEIDKDSRKKDVHLIHFPPVGEAKDGPWVVLCAGGGYTSVCSMVEAYPIAVQLNELGYHAFVVNYRIGNAAVMPAPLHDLAAAIKYILAHKEKFSLKKDAYVVGGCSAGGNLTALWGTKMHGSRAYGLPAPVALFPVYPAVTSRLCREIDSLQGFLYTMVGEDAGGEKIKAYDVDLLMDSNYPPCYIVCCKDDPVVPYAHSECLKECLDAHRIPAVLEIGERGGHSFGEGNGTDVEGWVARAMEFAVLQAEAEKNQE